MPSFQTMFMQSGGQPIQWEGKTLHLYDYLAAGPSSYRLTFESCQGRRRQGVSLKLVHRDVSGRLQSGPGKFVVNGQAVSGKTGIVLWHDTAPRIVDLEIVGETPLICVHNVWEATPQMPGATVRPFTDGGHNGAAMIVEELPHGRRYRCNDGEPDEDFDDLVFRLERVP